MGKEHCMKKRITKLTVMQTGKMLGALYCFFSLVMLPFFLIGIIADPKNFFMLFMLLLYPIMGFIGGILIAFFYNIVAKWIGGIEVSVEETEIPDQQ